jgi:lysine 2,3-aminomutase
MKQVVTKKPSDTLRSLSDLDAAGIKLGGARAALESVAKRYAIAVTPSVLGGIDRGDPADPLARQFIPAVQELQILPHELTDPIGDAAHSPVEGIVHRYPDRVLMKIVHSCPVYCRFCFRREMVGPGGSALSGLKLEAAIQYIADTPSIWEVIMTGGDPFVLSARRVREITRRLAAIGHVKIIRWHTRVPVVDPARLSEAYVRALKAPGVATYVAVHANHANEFSDLAKQGLARLADAGLVLISQTVLLKGVNDNPDVLAALMRCFVENRVKPYYLHHPDLAPGTSHFRLTIAEGQAIVAGLRGKLSGLCQPDYVLDIPGGFGKIPVGQTYLDQQGDRVILTDYRGGTHLLPEP